MFKQIFEIFKSDSLYEQALGECHEMLDIDLTMFKASIKSLRKSDSADIDIDIFRLRIGLSTLNHYLAAVWRE